MTRAARIPQADIDRAFKGLARANIDRATVRLCLARREIIVTIGDSAPPADPEEEWSDDDI